MKKMNGEPPKIETIEDAAYLMAFLIEQEVIFDEEMGLEDIEAGKIVYNQFARNRIIPESLDMMQGQILKAYEIFRNENANAQCFVAIMQLRKLIMGICETKGKIKLPKEKIYGFREEDLRHPLDKEPAQALYGEVEIAVSRLAMAGVSGFVQDGRGFVGLDMDVVREQNDKEISRLVELILRLDFEINPEPAGFAYPAGELSMDEAITDIMGKVDGIEDEDLQNIDEDEDYDDSVVSW